MSYDIDLQIDTGNEYMTTVVTVGNYTSNVYRMWEKALGNGGLDQFHGKLASEAIEPLRKGIAHMQDNGHEYEPLNPSSGWGNYRGALQYMQDFLKACIEHPKTTIYVSC